MASSLTPSVRTSDDAIVAAGDCTRFDFRGTMLRLESVQNATDQGAAAAATLAGIEQPYQPFPWFWSDQYDLKLKIAGLNHGYQSTVTGPGNSPIAGRCGTTGTMNCWPLTR